MQGAIDKQFAALSYTSKLAEAKQKQGVWSDFIDGEYREVSKFTDKYKIKVKDFAKEWASTWAEDEKTDLRCLYNSSGELLYCKDNFDGYDSPLPERPEQSEDMKEDDFDPTVSWDIVLPAKYLHIENADDINASNYAEEIRKAVSSAVGQAITDGVIEVDAGKFKNLNKGNMTEKEAVQNRITEDIINSMFHEINDLFANRKVEGLSTTYATRAIELYNRFCSKLAQTKDNPLKAALDSLALTYAFESDAREDAKLYYGLVGLAVFDFGELTFTLAKMTNMSNDSKAQIIILTGETLDANSEIYHGFITGKDNYCYPLGGFLSYVDVTAQSVIKTHSVYRGNDDDDDRGDHYNEISDWALVDSSLNIDTDDMDYYEQESKNNEALLRSCVLSSDDLHKLMCYIDASSNEDILGYLQNYSVIPAGDKHSTTLITSNFEIKDQPVDEKTIYKVLPYHYDNFKTEDYREGDHINAPEKGYEEGDYNTVLTGFDQQVHDKLVGDLFSIGGSAAGVMDPSDISSRYSRDVTLGVRILSIPRKVRADSGDWAPCDPNYLFYDDSQTATLSLTEDALNSKGHLGDKDAW